MHTLDCVPISAARCGTPPSLGPPTLAFTRALFRSNGGVHTESRCNQCGFAMSGAPERLDKEEREHARDCQGSWME